MTNTVKLKRSAVSGKTPLITDLQLGELALNTYDGNLFFKKSVSGTDTIVTAVTLDGPQTLTNKTLTSPILNGTTTLAGSEVLVTAGSGGDEGGELHFKIPVTGTSLAGPIALDIYQNKVRIFETTGTNRGVYVDLTTTGNSVGSSLVTDNGTQTLTNKTLNGVTLTGPVTTNGNSGANGYILVSAGPSAPPQWQANTAGTLDGLSDVVLTSPSAQQILKYNGSIWQNADPDTNIASAVFATNAQSDLGSVTDLVIGTSEDLGLVTDVAAYIYNMGALVVDGIVSLNNIDQSIKADYIAYSIIFGF